MQNRRVALSFYPDWVMAIHEFRGEMSSYAFVEQCIREYIPEELMQGVPEQEWKPVSVWNPETQKRPSQMRQFTFDVPTELYQAMEKAADAVDRDSAILNSWIRKAVRARIPRNIYLRGWDGKTRERKHPWSRKRRSKHPAQK